MRRRIAVRERKTIRRPNRGRRVGQVDSGLENLESATHVLLGRSAQREQVPRLLGRRVESDGLARRFERLLNSSLLELVVCEREVVDGRVRVQGDGPAQVLERFGVPLRPPGRFRV